MCKRITAIRVQVRNNAGVILLDCSEMKAHGILTTVTIVKGLQACWEGKLTLLRKREIGFGSEPHSPEPTRLTCISYDPSRLYVTAMTISLRTREKLKKKKKERKHYVTMEMTQFSLSTLGSYSKKRWHLNSRRHNAFVSKVSDWAQYRQLSKPFSFENGLLIFHTFLPAHKSYSESAERAIN